MTPTRLHQWLQKVVPAMAKGAKKKSNPSTQLHLPNNWVRVANPTGNSRCTECNVVMGRGMRWMVGDVHACQRCGQQLARKTALAA